MIERSEIELPKESFLWDDVILCVVLYQLVQLPPWLLPEVAIVALIYRMSQEECSRFREGVPYGKVYRCNPKHLCLKLIGYRDNDQRSLKL
jgi:hypothetical protein